MVALDSRELAAAIRGAQDDAAGEWQDRADTVEAKLEELATVYAHGSITMREWLAAREPLQGQLDEARRHLSRAVNTGPAARYLGGGKQLREQWQDLDVERLTRSSARCWRMSRSVRGGGA